MSSRGIAVALAAAVVTTAATAGRAQAASLSGGGGCQTVHVGALRTADAPRLSYFALTMRAGATRRQSVIVANPQHYPCKVTLTQAYGQTAINSGDTYATPRRGHRCAETSCWLSRLPVTVTVPAGSRLTVPFLVSVPKHTRAGQYLAGVVAQPASRARAPRHSRRASGFGAAVVARVAIGVAVTVRGRLKPQLTIPSVRLDTRGGVPLMRITVHDPGNTWEHPAGDARIRVGRKTRRLGVRSSTVLPGDSATLSIPAARISRGSWPTRVVLWYDHHHKRAVWSGPLGFPAASVSPARTPAVPLAVAPRSGLPLWAKLVMAALGLAVAALASLLVLVYRRRRAADDAATPEATADSPA